MALGPHGRAIAASVNLTADLELRVLALYGVSGSCLPGFLQREAAVKQEQDLNAFVREQSQHALHRNAFFVAAGDLNSIGNEHLDVWQGSAQPRADSLLGTLLACGLRDTFRQRHPLTRAFSFFSQAGGASRLDYVLWRAPLDQDVPLLNSAVVWAHPRRIDHDPIVADFAVPFPTMPEEVPDEASRKWRLLVDRLDSTVRARVVTLVREYHGEISEVREQLEIL